MVETSGAATRTLEASGATTVSGRYALEAEALAPLMETVREGIDGLESGARAPLRVVALGRSGVGKSHVLNALLRELARRGNDDAKDVERRRTWSEATALTITSMVAHDQAAEEEAADKLRAIEDGGSGAALDANARMFAPPPALDREKTAAMYVPRHLRGRAIRGDAFKDSEAENLQKEKMNRAKKQASKKGQPKATYLLYKEHQEQLAREAAARAAEEEKLRNYENMIDAYELPARSIPFSESPDPPEEFLSEDVRMPFLLPEGDVMDTTSVASSVSTSDTFRVTLVYFAPDVVKKHVHALRHAVRVARQVAEAQSKLGDYAETFVRREIETTGANEVTLLDFKKKAREGEFDPNDGYGLPSELRVACAMVGLDPNMLSLEDVDEDKCAIPPQYITRLGQRVVFEYEPDSPSGKVDYSVADNFYRALRATKHTIWTQTHTPASCWGLLREVRIDIPVPPENRGLVLVDAPGAGDTDPARDRHLIAALRNASAVICLGDARETTGDIVRALHKSGFLQQLITRPATRRLINAVQGDRIWGDSSTTFRKARALLKSELGKEVTNSELEEHQPPIDKDIQWAIDRVINQNSVTIANVRRNELLGMLMDQSGSVAETMPTANAVISVAWKFVEIRSSWSAALDPTLENVREVTGHACLYSILDELKHARDLKLLRRSTRKVHDALQTFCKMAEPLVALPSSCDDSLRGFHDEIEFRLGEDASYAGRKVWEAAYRFCRETVSSALSESIKSLEAHAIKYGDAKLVRTVLTKTLNREKSLELRRQEIRTQKDVEDFIMDAKSSMLQIIGSTFDGAFKTTKNDSSEASIGSLLSLCNSVLRHWAAQMMDDKDDCFEAMMKERFTNLVGEKKDPSRAMMRSFMRMALRNFKLTARASKAYTPNRSIARDTEALHQKCMKRINAVVNKQVKAIAEGCLCAHWNHDDEGHDALTPTPEGVDAFMVYTINAFSLSACTMYDLIVDEVEQTIIQWFEPLARRASEDVHKSCLSCVRPYVKKQVMPEFRTLVARPQMVRAIEQDLSRVYRLMEVTTAVLGDEAAPAISNAEKVQRLMEKSRLGARPYVLTRRELSHSKSCAEARTSDDAVRISLDEFPIAIHMVKDAAPPEDNIQEEPEEEVEEEEEEVEEEEEEDSIQETLVIEQSPAQTDDDEVEKVEKSIVKEVVEQEAVEDEAFFTVGHAPAQQTTPMKDVQTQTDNDDSPTSFNLMSPSSARQRGIAVQTDDGDDGPVETTKIPSHRIQAPVGVDEQFFSSSKSEDTMTPKKKSPHTVVKASRNKSPESARAASARTNDGDANRLPKRRRTEFQCVQELHTVGTKYPPLGKKKLRLAAKPYEAPPEALEMPHPALLDLVGDAPDAEGSRAFDFESDQEAAPPSRPAARVPVTAFDESRWKHLDPTGSPAGLAPVRIPRSSEDSPSASDAWGSRFNASRPSPSATPSKRST